MRKCEMRSINPNELSIPLGTGAATTALVYESSTPAAAALILGHGAGAGQRSGFMVDFARALAALGIQTITFNFLYTERRPLFTSSPAVIIRSSWEKKIPPRRQRRTTMRSERLRSG